MPGEGAELLLSPVRGVGERGKAAGSQSVPAEPLLQLPPANTPLP